ncbi:MAG: DUF6580 family putative transport protein [Candidatus Woykebacteria bacterium]
MRKFIELAASSALIIGSAVGLRLIPHMPNFAPVGAMALFGGAYLPRKYALLALFAVMLVSDYLLLYFHPFSADLVDFSRFYGPSSLIHSTTVFVYVSFFINFLIGRWIARKRSVERVAAGALAASIQFFIVTNFGVWVAGGYSRYLYGLLQSYIMALPFFRGTLFGDLFYTGLFFGSYEVVKSLIVRRSLAHKEAKVYG